MTDPIEQLFRDARTVRMTPAQKQATRHMLQAYARTYVHRVPLWAVFARHAAAYSVLIAVLFVGGTSAFAQRATPDGFLYPLKVTVNDRVAVAIAGSEDARLEKELEQIERIIADEEVAAGEVLADIDLDDDDDDIEAELRELERMLGEEEVIVRDTPL